MAKKAKTAKSGKAARRAKTWKWTKRIALGTSAFIVIREMYLGFGPRREYRRSVFEQAKRRAQELDRPLLVLGDPDSGLMNHMLGRQWQCGDICVDPKGCGICPDWVQGPPQQVLEEMEPDSVVVYDPGAFARAENGSAFLDQVARVSGGHVFMADAGAWTLTAFLGPKRKRRMIKPPQANQNVVDWKPLLFHPELDTGRQRMDTRLAGFLR